MNVEGHFMKFGLLHLHVKGTGDQNVCLPSFAVSSASGTLHSPIVPRRHRDQAESEEIATSFPQKGTAAVKVWKFCEISRLLRLLFAKAENSTRDDDLGIREIDDSELRHKLETIAVEPLFALSHPEDVLPAAKDESGLRTMQLPFVGTANICCQ